MADPIEGRGAWTERGKRNKAVSYVRKRGFPRDGTMPTGPLPLDDEERQWFVCVNLGVLAIQRELAAQGHGGPDLVPGVFGNLTKQAVQSFQKEKGLKDDGYVGTLTMRALLAPVITREAVARDINPGWIYGLARQESALDPGAQGWSTPGDRGIWQFNTLDGPYSPEQASDIAFAAEAVCKRWAAARNQFDGKGIDLRVDCCIMQHRSPVAAGTWFDTGKSPSPDATAYVNAVRAFAADW